MKRWALLQMTTLPLFLLSSLLYLGSSINQGSGEFLLSFSSYLFHCSHTWKVLGVCKWSKDLWDLSETTSLMVYVWCPSYIGHFLNSCHVFTVYGSSLFPAGGLSVTSGLVFFVMTPSTCRGFYSENQVSGCDPLSLKLLNTGNTSVWVYLSSCLCCHRRRGASLTEASTLLLWLSVDLF